MKGSLKLPTTDAPASERVSVAWVKVRRGELSMDETGLEAEVESEPRRCAKRFSSI